MQRRFAFHLIYTNNLVTKGCSYKSNQLSLTILSFSVQPGVVLHKSVENVAVSRFSKRWRGPPKPIYDTVQFITAAALLGTYATRHYFYQHNDRRTTQFAWKITQVRNEVRPRIRDRPSNSVLRVIKPLHKPSPVSTKRWWRGGVCVYLEKHL